MNRSGSQPPSSVPAISSASVRRSSIRRRAALSTPSAGLSTILICIWCCVSCIVPAGAVHVCIWALGLITVDIHAIAVRITFSQTNEEGGQLCLQHLDALLDNIIRGQIASSFDFKVETPGNCVVIEWFAFLNWVFPVCVLALWPEGSVSFYAGCNIVMLFTIPSPHFVQTTSPCAVTCCGDHIRSR